MTASALLTGLNKQQQQAVLSRAAALLIVAGAGSGKTRVLTHRIAHLIATGEAYPSQILAITFTNKAAGEMRERITELLGDTSSGMWISTFHATCVKILRKEAERFGYSTGFTIYDSADSRALLKRIIKEQEADVYHFTPASCAARISRLKNELKDASDFAANANYTDPKERAFATIFAAYEEQLRRAQAFDFDDLLTQTVQLFRAFPEVRARYQQRFRFILVDEYQDTNHAQYALIRELTHPISAANLAEWGLETRAKELDAAGNLPGSSLTVVGDSDQSIYAFRGADIRNIREFERDFSDAEVIKLEQNYRSTQTILSAANAIIAQNPDRQEKNLWTASGDGTKIIGFAGYSQHDEARFVADEIELLNAKGTAYSDIAVFYRTNSQTRALEEMLMRAAIPYRVMGGTKFYERSEIKDMLAYLTSIINPYDPLAWSRLLGAPKRGIGPATEAQIALYQETNNLNFHEAMLAAAEIGLGQKARTAVLALGQLLHSCAQRAFGDNTTDTPPAPVAEIIETILEHTGYVELLRAKRDPQEEARAENVEELLAQAREFDKQNPGAGLTEYLTEVSLVAAADDLDDYSGAVSLMTLHTAKGLEYPTVFLTGLEEGLLPHQMSFDDPFGVEEERRLMYVGVTRARKQLYLTLAATRAVFGDISAAIPSRFLSDIPENLLEWRQAPGEVAGTNFGGGLRPAARSGTGAARISGAGFSVKSTDESDSGAMANAMQAWRERKKQAAAAQAAGKGFSNMINATVLRDSAHLQLAVGDRVLHESYGEGQVLRLSGSGSKQIAHIEFAQLGEKKLLVRLAPLQKLSAPVSNQRLPGVE